MPSTTFANTSNLATSGAYIESYGGGTSGTTAGFDGLVLINGRHYLSGLGRFTTPQGNNPFIIIPLLLLTLLFIKGDQPIKYEDQPETIEEDKTNDEFPKIKAEEPEIEDLGPRDEWPQDTVSPEFDGDFKL